MREQARKSANDTSAPKPADKPPVQQAQESFKPSQNPQSELGLGRRTPQPKGQLAKYNNLMDLVEELRQQFPFASDEQILEWAKKRMEFDENQNSIWDNVAREHGMPARAPSPKQQNWSASNTPEWKEFAEQNGVPPSVGWKNSEQTPMSPYRKPPDPAPAPSPASNDQEPFVVGKNGSWAFNPEWGRKHGLIWDGNKWMDGGRQQQEIAAARAEQSFLEQKRGIELDRLRMELELDRLRKQRAFSDAGGDSALSGLLGGSAQPQQFR